MCYSQGSELTSFIDDAFCCVLFKVKQRTMKKIQATPHSCRKQDKSSVKHGSIFFPKTGTPILANAWSPL